MVARRSPGGRVPAHRTLRRRDRARGRAAGSPRGERRRVALLLDPAAIARIGPPLGAARRPARARARLVARAPPSRSIAARAGGVLLRVYGSLAWQHLSGLPSVTAGSDVDLLAEPRSATELRSALELLRAREADCAPRLDGEVVLAGGRAVAWRELVAAPRGSS